MSETDSTVLDPHDRGMLKVMGVVLGALVLFTAFIVLIARLLGIGVYDEVDSIAETALLERIAPVGEVRTEPLPEQDVASAEEGGEQVASSRSGEELANGACAACHSAGVGGAPAFDDDAAWSERAEAGLDALVASVVNGKGAMPAGGGSDYSEEEIRRAVAWMAGLEQQGGEQTGALDTDDATRTASRD